MLYLNWRVLIVLRTIDVSKIDLRYQVAKFARDSLIKKKKNKSSTDSRFGL